MKGTWSAVIFGALVFTSSLVTLSRAQTPPAPDAKDQELLRELAPFEKVLPAAEVNAMRAAVKKGFPKPGIDIVHHVLKVDVLQIQPKKGGKVPTECQEPEDVGATAQVLETLDFEGRMALERTIPTLDKKNRALTNFRVLTWQATSFSQKLQVDILYILSQDTKQEMGEIRSQQEATGFPAEFTFDLTFDARANNKTIVARHHGMPKGHSFMSIPPDVKSPPIHQFEACYVQMTHPQYGLIRFVPKECNDKSGKTTSLIPADRALKTVDLDGIRKDITKKPSK